MGGSARILRALAPHFAELLRDPVEVSFKVSRRDPSLPRLRSG